MGKIGCVVLPHWIMSPRELPDLWQWFQHNSIKRVLESAHSQEKIATYTTESDENEYVGICGNFLRKYLHVKFGVKLIHALYSTQLVVQTLIISHLDYCKSLLTGLPAFAIKPHQMVLNAAVHLITQPRSAHVTPLITALHWLPIAVRIRFKALLLAFKSAKGTPPLYIQTLIAP